MRLVCFPDSHLVCVFLGWTFWLFLVSLKHRQTCARWVSISENEVHSQIFSVAFWHREHWKPSCFFQQRHWNDGLNSRCGIPERLAQLPGVLRPVLWTPCPTTISLQLVPQLYRKQPKPLGSSVRNDWECFCRTHPCEQVVFLKGLQRITMSY